MIDKLDTFGDQETYDVLCDKCSYSEYFEVFSFTELIQQMRENNWKSQKDKNGQWEHICFECQKKERLK